MIRSNILRRSVPALAVLALTLSACSSSGGGSIASRSAIQGCPAPTNAVRMAATTSTMPERTAEPTFSDVRGQNAALDAAVAAYDEAMFESAATQFQSVGQSNAASLDQRRVAYRMLGRAQLALGNQDGAMSALTSLVALEPPMIRLDPNVEPLQLLEAFYQVRHNADGNYAVKTNRDKTLAIADFTNGSMTDAAAVDALTLGLPSLMIDRMRASTTLELVERVRLQWLLDELSLGTSEDAGRRAGSLLGADQVVFGTYIKNGDQMLMTARVVDVESGRILASERMSGPASNFSGLVDCLSQSIANAVGADLPTADASQSIQSLDAMVAYARGLALEESEDYTGAAEQYQMALRLSPDYGPAKTRLNEGIAPFMAMATNN